MRKNVRAARGVSSGMLLFDRHRDAIFYLVVAVFIGVDLLQITLLLPAIPGITQARLAGIVALGVFAAIAGFFHFTKRRAISSIVLLTTAYIALVYAALKQGGAPAPTLIYAPFLPIVTTVLLGRKAGVVSVIVSAGVMTFCAYAASAGIALPSPHSPEQLRVLYTSAAILLTVGVATYAFIYEELIVRAMKAVATAQRDLQTKADALAESSEFLSAIMEAAHDSIIAADTNGRLSAFIRATRQFEEVVPQPSSSAEWPEFFQVYHIDGKRRMKEHELPLVRALRGETVAGCELVMRRPGDKLSYVLVSASPLNNQKSENIGAVATVRDITLEKQQEEKIREQNREIDQFARVASVDLQEPLTRIVTTAETLLDAPEARHSGRIRNELSSIATTAKRIGALIKDVLYMSRIPIGEMTLQPVTARDCIDAAIDLLAVSEAECRLDFRFGGSPEIIADPHSLTLVFRHLIENAWKHARADAKPHVEFTCTIEDGAAVLGVKDNGPGMTEEDAERLFLPLERVRTGEDEQGSGLGLAICRKSLTRMGGEFWLETEPGMGCHFRLRLPLAESKAA